MNRHDTSRDGVVMRVPWTWIVVGAGVWAAVISATVAITVAVVS